MTLSSLGRGTYSKILWIAIFYVSNNTLRLLFGNWLRLFVYSSRQTVLWLTPRSILSFLGNFFHTFISNFIDLFIIIIQTTCWPITCYISHAVGLRLMMLVSTLIIRDIAKLHPVTVNTEWKFEPCFQRSGGPCTVSIWPKWTPCTDPTWLWRVLSTG